MKKGIGAALLMGALALSPAFASADEGEGSLEQLIVNMAHTSADHAAVAKYYRRKAAHSRAAASDHVSMASSYGGGKMVQREEMASHCKKISELDAAKAAEYDALAKLHEEEAKKAK